MTRFSGLSHRHAPYRQVVLGLTLVSLLTLVASATLAQPTDLFSDTAVNIQLIDPVDPEQEKARAEAEAGRTDPFVPLNLTIATPTPLPPPPPILTIPGENGEGTVIVDATPTPDPARFARTVLVSGVVSLDGDVYALVTGDQAVPSVVRRGDRFRTATIVGVSFDRQEVILQEGGITVTRRVDEPVALSPEP
ncbi:MAG: hypothetical protein OHK0012_14110 [Synechococcales cyanobacterium]